MVANEPFLIPSIMSSNLDDVTLQINLSAGDVNYAHLTVPALVRQHAGIKKRLLVVDCCRPQKTSILDPDIRFPLVEFEHKVDQITKISKELLANGIVSDLYLVKPEDPIIPYLSKKYLRGLYKTTHGAGGMVNMSYWVGFDKPKTRYLLHYDGDMLLYQKQGYSWVKDAIDQMVKFPESVFSIPRLCPPVEDLSYDLPSLQEGRINKSYQNYWANDFFSTRQFLLDKERLNCFLPLVQGKVMIELLIRKFTHRAYPLDPEILMMKSIGGRGGKRLVLKNRDAWILHPMEKSKLFIDNLPELIALIAAGKCPEEQKGYENLKLDAWINFMNKGHKNNPEALDTLYNN